MEYIELTADRRAISQLERAREDRANVLITGVKGTGKERILKVLAKKMLCRETADKMCGCASCQRALEYHPDFVEVVTEKVIKKEQIDAVLDAVGELPQVSDCRVVMIHGAHRLGNAAANALLKTMEEGKRTVFILSADAKVPDTIRSRCRIIELMPMLPKLDIGAEREIVRLCCDSRIDYIQQFAEDGFFRKLSDLKELLYGMTQKSQWMTFFGELREKDENEFFMTSTEYQRDAVLWMMSKVFYWTKLHISGIDIPGAAGSQALAANYDEKGIDRVLECIDWTLECHCSPSFTKTDWFRLVTALTM